MPANLTPQYLDAELKFKQAKTTPEKIKALEVMMAVIPKHKGTERLRVIVAYISGLFILVSIMISVILLIIAIITGYLATNRHLRKKLTCY